MPLAPFTDTERLQLTLQALPVILIEWTLTGTVTYICGRGLRHLQITPIQVLGHSVFELLRHEPEILVHVHSALAGEVFTTIETFRNRIFEAHYRPSDQLPLQEPQVLCIALDVTERTLLGEHLLKHVATLTQAGAHSLNGAQPIEKAYAYIATQLHERVEHLSPREREILICASNGMRNTEIACHLNIARGTVKWYLEQIYRKLHVSNRMAAVCRARDLELLP